MVLLEGQTSDARKANPGQLREQKMISYFCGRREEKLGDYLLSLPRYRLPFASIQCYLGHVRSCFFHLALNGLIVGLSADSSFMPGQERRTGVEEDDHSVIPKARFHPKLLTRLPIVKNVGIGIVQAIDLNRNEVIVITPLGSEEMKEVNTLIRHTECIPQVLVQNVGVMVVDDGSTRHSHRISSLPTLVASVLPLRGLVRI